MKVNSSTKRTVGERVLSGGLALVLGVSCVATNFFGILPKDKASVVLAASSGQYMSEDVIRSSYKGDYKPGETYYDFGELKGRAYYDPEKGWQSTGDDNTYAHDGWQIRNVHSFLDKDNDGRLDANTTKVANTLPYTTDVNATVSDTDSAYQKELMCWQAYATDESRRTRFLERTDVPDFASPPYGDDVDAYYIAEGVAEKGKDDEVTITWSIRSWPKDSEGWIDPDTFSKTGLTGLSGAITENGVDNTNLDDEFISYFNTHDEVDDLWNKADFTAKSLWFGDRPSTWWDGVAAAIYQADVQYDRLISNNLKIGLTVDNVTDIYGNDHDGDGHTDVDYGTIDTWLPVSKFSKAIGVVGNYGYAEDILTGKAEYEPKDSTPLVTYVGEGSNTRCVITKADGTKTEQSVKAVRLLATGNDFSGNDSSDAKTDALIGITLDELASKKYADAENGKRLVIKKGDAYFTTGSQMNKWKNEKVLKDANAMECEVSGETLTDAVDTGVTVDAYDYDADKYYEFVNADNINNDNHGGYCVFGNDGNTTSYVSLFETLSQQSYTKHWIFSDHATKDEIVDDICSAIKYDSSKLSVADREAIIKLARDVQVDYDPEKGYLWVNGLFRDGFRIGKDGPSKYAISMPLVAYLGTLADIADHDNIVKEKIYFTTGYQRAAGEVKAKQVESDITSIATAPDGGTAQPKENAASANAVINDAVSCNNLVAGHKYLLVGALYEGGKGENGGAIKKDGAIGTDTDVIDYDASNANNYVIVAQPFTADATSKTVNMTYTYNSTKLVGKTVVVCVKLYDVSNTGHELVASHLDKDNAAQSVTVVDKSLSTVAVDNTDGNKGVYKATNITIKDTVSYTGLIPGQEYELVPYIQVYNSEDKAQGELIGFTVSNNLFTPATHFGKQEVLIENVDTTGLDTGSKLVIGQKLYLKNDATLVAEHFVTDGTQTVNVIDADLATTATAYDGKSSSIECDGSAIILDKVAYAGLIPNTKYILKTSIYDKTADKWYNDVNVQPFTADDVKNEVDVKIIFDTSALKGHTLVLAEDVYLGTKLIASHKDVNDVNQTVTVESPSIRTVATAADKTSKTIDVLGNATIVDTVSYSNLAVGSTYKLVGSLYDITAKEYVVKNVSSDKFAPTSANDTATVTFTGLNVIARQGHKLVVEEKLYLVTGTTETEIASHEDRNDSDQTVIVKQPSIATNATNGNGGKVVNKSSNAVIVDEVAYENLAVGTQYKLTASLVDAETKNVLATYDLPFTPKKTNDVIPMEMTLDTTALDGKHINVEQRLYIDDALVLTHVDPSAAQTVVVNKPVIRTSAKRTVDTSGIKSKYIPCGYDTVFIDRVYYEGLTAGNDYILVTEIYDRTAYDADQSKVKIGDSSTTKFTADEASGRVNVNVSIDATQYIGHIIVVTETLYEANGDSLGKKIAEHVDLADNDQSVMVETPEIHTIATGVGMGKTIATLDKVTISDEIYFKNFPTTGTYTLITGLYDATTGKYVDDAIKTTELAGSAIQNDKFTVTFDVDTTPFAGHKLVVTQTIKHNTTSLVIHTDFTDEDQTVTVLQPELKTVAVDKASKSKNVVLSSDAVIVDTVTLTGLYPGTEYTLEAAVYDKSTGKMVNIKSGSLKFKASSSSNQVVDVEIALDATEVPSDTLVVYEYLYNNGKLIASHEDKNDEDQTVTVSVPGIKTMALDGLSNSHTGVTSKKSVIKDTVTYTGLTAGVEYELQADIYDAKNGTKINTDSVRSTFTPSAANGTTVVSITVDTSDFADKSIVVFERLYFDGKLVAVHEDMNDANQTVTYVKPEIRTVASNKTYDSKNIECAKSAVVVDKLYYSNFVAGRTYSVDASIVDITDDNKVVATKSFTFTADTVSGNVSVEFDVDTTALKGHELVVCETVSTMSDTDDVAGDTGAFTVVHNDLKDADQTVYVDIPKIRTNASSKATGNHTVEKAEKAVIVDRVTYSGLVVGKKYSVTATPYNKATGKALEGVTPVTVEFTAKHTDGYIDVELTINSTQLAGTTIVMFESLKYEGVEIAVHNDINDEDQTVHVMDIKTKATAADKQSKILPQNADVKVIDTVTYKGLTVGETYVLTGQLVDKADPTKVVAESTLEFVPKTADGDVEITFEFNTTGKERKSYVAFETVTQKSNNQVVGSHKDIQDADQTVTVLSPPPKTGDDSPVLYLTLMMLLSFAGFAGLFIFARKRRKAE